MQIPTNDKDKHIQLVMRGNREKQEFFHYLLAQFDRDWPFKPKESLVCKICSGGIYKNPRFVPTQLKALSYQINDLKAAKGNLKIKIRGFSPHKTCYDIALKGGK
jgi:hypothetical protein